MNIHVHTRGLSLSEPLRQHLEACLAAATRPFGHAVSRITVRLTDVNADRGGNDKQCRLVAVLPHRRLVVTESRDADAYRSVEMSAGRLRRAITRELGRDRRRERRLARHFSARVPLAG
jgi:ribosome-associated translation inhibitor RaiA